MCVCVFGGVFKISIFHRKSVSNILSDCLVITLYLGEVPASHWGTSPAHKALGVEKGPPWTKRRKPLGRFQAEASGAVLADSEMLRDVPASPSGAQGCWMCWLPAPSCSGSSCTWPSQEETAGLTVQGCVSLSVFTAGLSSAPSVPKLLYLSVRKGLSSQL